MLHRRLHGILPRKHLGAWPVRAKCRKTGPKIWAKKNYNRGFIGRLAWKLRQGRVTILLNRVKQGEPDALAELIPLVYKELRRLAGHFMREERVGHTLQPTALVHETYLCLLGQEQTGWQNRAQFMAIAAQIMRRILLQYARRRGAGKRMTRGRTNLPFPRTPCHGKKYSRRRCPQPAQRVGSAAGAHRRDADFGGLSVDETAEALGVSRRTVKREWSVAKGWLNAQLSEDRSNDGGTLGAHNERLSAASERPVAERIAYLDEPAAAMNSFAAASSAYWPAKRSQASEARRADCWRTVWPH